MFDFAYFPVLLAQAQEQSTFVDQALKVAYILGVFALVFVLPFFLGRALARLVRMPDYGFRFGLIFTSLALALLVLVLGWDWEKNQLDIPLGVDLKGGVILVYEVEPAEEEGRINMGDLINALTNRINPSGTKEIVIRQYGERQVEIIIPEVETEEVEEVKRRVRTAGQLEFRIVANRRDHERIITAAESQAESDSPSRFQRTVTLDGEEVGFWAQAAQEKLKPVEVRDTIMRDAETGRIVTLDDIGRIESADQTLDEFLQANLESSGIENLDILVATDDGCNVTGDHLGVVSRGNAQDLSPCVNFQLRGRGARLFGLLTGQNLPDEDAQPPFYRHLGIILDQRLISFPRIQSTIQDRGQITGEFTTEEVDFLVGILRAGRLPATLKKEPISENQIGSVLGDDTIRKGKISIVISLAAVLIFVAVYYRFAGLVACTALLLNLVLILAMMMVLNAPLTLPGLAGLVLTIGMSVDANVLIFERIREELSRGAALRMAIQNGFSRATTTIVDANVTTLITAIVLYAIGTDQVRGFAVTLILGILMSMYTAIYCSRAVFDVVERRRWITKLKMLTILGATKLDFIGKRRIALIASCVVIVLGLTAVGARGKRIFDIDFNGGLSVTMVLKEPMAPSDVRSRINRYFEDSDPAVRCTVNTVDVDEYELNTVYKIDAGLPERNVSVLENAIEETFRDDASGQSLLQSYVMEFGQLREEEVSASGTEATGENAPVKSEKSEKAEAKPEAEADTRPKPETESKETPADDPANEEGPTDQEDQEKTSRRDDLPPANLLAMALPAEQAPPEATDESAGDPAGKADEEGTGKAKADSAAKLAAAGDEDQAGPDEPKTEEDAAEAAEKDVRTVAVVNLQDRINALTLRQKITNAYRTLFGGDVVPALHVAPDESFNWDQDSAESHNKWYVTMRLARDEARQVLEEMKTNLANTPVFPSASKIGGKVAGDTRKLAIAALVASLFGIIGYIWIRFQRVVFGVAAVVALVHDVLITLGAIAISAYLAEPLGFLLVDEFRISLPIVAAFLTIIGYSLNDTIVVFDRIREVRGKSPDLTAEMINNSINQTLGRTLLTSLTTLLVVSILYTIGGQGIHGFAFALVIGVFAGTYSSVFVASPALLWMFNLRKTGNS
ncbi:MAG: protein translocase subunit SecD [Planctomycetota bacterium]